MAVQNCLPRFFFRQFLKSVADLRSFIRVSIPKAVA